MIARGRTTTKSNGPTRSILNSINACTTKYLANYAYKKKYIYLQWPSSRHFDGNRSFREAIAGFFVVKPRIHSIAEENFVTCEWTENERHQTPVNATKQTHDDSLMSGRYRQVGFQERGFWLSTATTHSSGKDYNRKCLSDIIFLKLTSSSRVKWSSLWG